MSLPRIKYRPELFSNKRSNATAAFVSYEYFWRKSLKKKQLVGIIPRFPVVRFPYEGCLLFVINGLGRASPAVCSNMLTNESISLMDEEPGSKSVPTDTNYFNMPLF